MIGLLDPGSFLGYCTNVHPAANAEAVIAQIRKDCAAVKHRLDSSYPFGIGLWLSQNRLQEFLRSPALLNQLREVCDETAIPIFSWNGFPQQEFHQEEVKEKVYFPDWSDHSRLQYTLDLMTLLIRLGTDLKEISISTLPLGSRSARWGQAETQAAVAHLMEFVVRSEEIQNKNGISIHLDLEPEPSCLLETSSEVVTFFKEHLLQQGAELLKNRLRLSLQKCEALILDKIRVCYDTCHAAVLYESPESILKNYDRLGIQVGKVQLSSGLSYRPRSSGGPGIDPGLLQLSSDRYLHQVVRRSQNGELKSYLDLKDVLAAWAESEPPAKSDIEYRIHYHVPIFLEQIGTLKTTQAHILELLALAQKRKITAHWEVETYTWSLFPKSMRTGELSELIAQEISWVAQQAHKGLTQW